jgi:Zn-dependent M28 family amino/carboxypeptidase
MSTSDSGKSSYMIDIPAVTEQVNTDFLKRHVQSITGPRHGWNNFERLEESALSIEAALRSCNLHVSSQPVRFHDRAYRNIIADTVSPADNGCILIGAHYDAAAGSPGADDNASGVAVMLEAARIIGGMKLNHPVRFTAFTLEEPQPHSVQILIGSKHFSEEAKKAGHKYDAVLILESVGYASNEKGSQIIPSFVRIGAGDVGNFLGVVSNRASAAIMKGFEMSVVAYVPDLPVYSYKTPFSGYLIPETRFSDHSPFWDNGFPALMLTDTAMFRNPNYHTEHDTADTLDFDFMAKVTKSVIAFILAFRLEDR